jgi:hypothetical protein
MAIGAAAGKRHPIRHAMRRVRRSAQFGGRIVSFLARRALELAQNR